MHGGSRCSVDTLWDQVGCQSNGLETGVPVHAFGMGTKKPGVSSPRLVPQQEYRCLPPRCASYLAAFGLLASALLRIAALVSVPALAFDQAPESERRVCLGHDAVVL